MQWIGVGSSPIINNRHCSRNLFIGCIAVFYHCPSSNYLRLTELNCFPSRLLWCFNHTLNLTILSFFPTNNYIFTLHLYSRYGK